MHDLTNTEGEHWVNERVTYRDKTEHWSVEVVAVRGFSDVLVHVSCSQPGAARLAVGDTIAIDVSPPDNILRRYTVSHIDLGGFGFVAHRTQRGPATTYLDSLQIGDVIFGQGPERPVKLPTAAMSFVAVLGDETVVGTAAAISATTTASVSVAMMTQADTTRWNIEGLVQATAISFCSNEEEMKKWLTLFLDQHGVSPDRHGVTNVGVFLVGEQAANQTLRQHAFSSGLAKQCIATRTFWRPDREGLE